MPDPDPQRDHFAVLGLEPSPWIDSGELEERYRERIRKAAEKAEPVHEAMRVLENRARRLAHFLALIAGRDITREREAPDSLTDLFMRMGPLFQETERMLRRIREATSPIARARIHLEAAPLHDRLSRASQEVSRRITAELDRLDTLRPLWNRQPDALVDQLADICRILLFLQRWQSHLTEKSFQITPG